jgi:hypothetical protein
MSLESIVVLIQHVHLLSDNYPLNGGQPMIEVIKNYIIPLSDIPDPEIDVDELESIIQQLDAISRGWADDYKVIIKEEIELVDWEWKSP